MHHSRTFAATGGLLALAAVIIAVIIVAALAAPLATALYETFAALAAVLN